MVYGRGVMHLSVLIETMRREGYELQVGQPQVIYKTIDGQETMRREGYELQVGQPQVIYKTIDGQRCEPIEEMQIEVPEPFSGKVVEMVNKRKGEMRVFMLFHVPSRGIIGLRTNMLTATTGEAIMNHRFLHYAPYKGDLEIRQNGSLIAMETGMAYAYALNKLQDRGIFFIDPGEQIYEGQVVGENNRADDLTINLTKSKKLTNVRAAGTDDKVKIAPAHKFSLEEAIEYIKNDEYVEVTPESIRLRKILLNDLDRKRANKSNG